jgi:Na+/H+ antiporter NhaD/arsenite permease-like protein
MEGGQKAAATAMLVLAMFFNAFPVPTSFLPLGRTTAVLLAAVGMVALDVTPGEEAYQDIDHNTLAFLFGMMAIKCLLEKHKFGHYLQSLLLMGGPSESSLLIRVGFLSAILSPFITNDGTCVFLTPVVEKIALNYEYQIMPLMLAICTCANIGSSATLTGNPQNVLIGAYSGLSYWKFLTIVGPAAFVGLLLNLAFLWVYSKLGWFSFADDITRTQEEKFLLENSQGSYQTTDTNHQYTKNENNFELQGEVEKLSATEQYFNLAISFSLVVMMVMFFFWTNVGWITAGVALVTMALEGIATRQEPNWVFAEVDWNLLAWFSGVFIVMVGFGRTGITAQVWNWLMGTSVSPESLWAVTKLSVIVMTLSNIVGNVPIILLMAPDILALDPYEARLIWILISWVSTISGNSTLLGSAANIIVAELNTTKDLTFFRYFKFGFPTTIIVIVVGLAVIYLTSAILN